MKKLLILLIVAILSFSTLVTVSAEENDAELIVTGDFDKETNIFSVHASVNNIEPEYGIIIVEYHINYDHNDLALMEANVNMPDLWKPYVDSQDAEDLSRRVADGKYSWAIVMAKTRLGIKEDEQLTIDLKFKVKKDSKVSLSFDRVVVATEIPFKYNGKTMYEPTEILVNDATLELDPKASGDDVSVDKNDVSKEPVVSQPTYESSEPVENEVPTVSMDEPVASEEPIESEESVVSGEPILSEEPTGSKEPIGSEEVEESVVSEEDDDPTVAESESASQNDGIIVMPEINNSSDGSSNESINVSNEASETIINLETDHSDMIQNIIWVIVGILGTIIVIITVVLIVRKSKKDKTDA